MDYEIAFDEENQTYRITTDYEFSVIGDWISDILTNRDNILQVSQLIRLAASSGEKQTLIQGPYQIEISESGVSVERQLDLTDAREEMASLFDGQTDFYRIADTGVRAECGLEDLTAVIDNWHDVLQ